MPTASHIPSTGHTVLRVTQTCQGRAVSARLASAAVTASPLDGPALQAVLKPWDAAAYPLQARRLRVLELPSHGRICGAETRVPAA